MATRRNSLFVKRQRDKDGWLQIHNFKVDYTQSSDAEVLFLGDSIVSHFAEELHYNVWKREVGKEALMLGVGGDKVENLLWRIINGKLPKCIKVIIVHIETNNIQKCKPIDVAEGIINICYKLHERKRHATIILTGILPGEGRPLPKVVSVDNTLNTMTIGNNSNIFFLPPDIREWITSDGVLKSSLYQKDLIHLSVEGYKLLTFHIQRISSHSQRSLIPTFKVPRPINYPSHASSTIGMLEIIGDISLTKSNWYLKRIQPGQGKSRN